MKSTSCHVVVKHIRKLLIDKDFAAAGENNRIAGVGKDLIQAEVTAQHSKPSRTL